MLTTNDVAKVFDTIMSIPGMNETVKIDLRISRKNVLLLNHVIERGLAISNDDKSSGLLSNVPEENLNELKTIADEYLEKAGLIELSEKLNELGKGK
jgi:t-SNARE complex subunit (syntaxin)